LFSTLYNKRELAEMHIARVSNLALLSKYSPRAWCNATGFPVRHCLPDYLPLRGATFLIRSLVYMIILPTLNEDLKRPFLKFAITGRRWVLESASAQLKLIYYCLPIQNLTVVSWKTGDLFNIVCKLVITAHSYVAKCYDDLCLCNINIFICK